MEEKPTSSGFPSESIDDLSIGPLQQKDVELKVLAENELCNTYLHKAIAERQEGVVDALLSQNVDMEIKNEEGETPLMVAVKHANEILVEKLISKGAVVDSEDDYGNTPLLQAVILNLDYIVYLLLTNGAACEVENDNSQTPLHVAIMMNFESIFDKLIAARADVDFESGINGTPIETALTSVNLRSARKLLAKGAKLCSQNVFRPLLKCYEKNFVTLMGFILDNGFDSNTKGCENWSLLHLAVSRSNITVVTLLLKKGANVNAKNKSGETPLHFAARLLDSSITKLLLEYKPDVNAIDVVGKTALHVAVVFFSTEIVRLLLNAGAATNIPLKSSLNLSLSLKTLTGKVTSYMLCARKMSLAKVCINLKQNDGTRTKHFTTLYNFDLECRKELDQIKEKKVGDISLYSIFSECNDPVFAGNSNMEVYVKSDNLQSDFPLYAGLLKRMFKEGVKRNNLLDDLSLCLKIVKDVNVTYIVLPYEISRKVLVYLKDCDLLSVKRAYNIR